MLYSDGRAGLAAITANGLGSDCVVRMDAGPRQERASGLSDTTFDIESPIG
jgi:hypothetical protein